MAKRGRPRKTDTANTKIVDESKENGVLNDLIICSKCGKPYELTEFYDSNSSFFGKKLPFCKHCIEEQYNYYVKKYQDECHDNPEKDAIRRICMVYDMYFGDNIYNSALKNMETETTMSLISAYFKLQQLIQYKRRTYDKTIEEDGSFLFQGSQSNEPKEIALSTIKFFGSGFSDEDYEFLQEQYDDWTSRHECNTKVQEEIFKRICFVQLEILKATRTNQDTKDLDATFQKLLDTGKLQPKQNTTETVSDSQVFGTLIDKWENTRPCPDIAPELRDVDRLGLYIDIFFKGHLAKMMGIKNGFSALYSKFISKYTVSKPEYNEEENSEALFDAIFGNQSLD